jgi:hypothetical protein
MAPKESPGEAEAAAEVVSSDRHLDATIAEIVRHTVVEEDYLYPTISESVPSAAPAAAAALEQSERTEVLLKELERRPQSDPGHDLLVGELITMIREHIELTERELFPALRATTNPLQLERLAGMAEMAKRTAPTHPHPGAPHDSRWSLVVTPGLGLVDKVRDLMTGRKTNPDRL